MKRRLIFTVDVDRDVNIQLEGREAAGSLDRGSGTDPRFSSSAEGIRLLVDLLDDLNIRATFFIEGRTAEMTDCSILSGHCIGFHGYDHEDLTKLSYIHSVMRRGYDAVRDKISAPTCFRAPYMTVSDSVFEELRTLGIAHDSSVYCGIDSESYDIGGITEHPVAKGKDAAGKTIAAYLWPMHEGKRKPRDYIELADSLEGDMVLSTHSWHIVEKREGGHMSDDEIDRNLSNIRKVLEGIIDLGFGPGTISG